MALVFKIKFQDTLRRWVVSEDLNSMAFSLTLGQLEAKIRELFQLSPTALLVITYVDKENDVVTLGDDQDLVDACLMQGLNPLRLDVYEKLNVSTPTAVPFPSLAEKGNMEAILKTIFPQAIFPQATADAIQDFLNIYAQGLDPMLPASTLVQKAQEGFKQFLESWTSHQGAQGVPNSSQGAARDPSSSQAAARGPHEHLYTPHTHFGVVHPLPHIENGAPYSQIRLEGLAAGGPSHAHGGFGGLAAGNPLAGLAEGGYPNIRFPRELPHAPVLPRAHGISHVFHGRVQCDGCGMNPIEGPRYKSTKVSNYDLCSSCYEVMGNESDFQKLEHPVHPPFRGHYRPPFLRRGARPFVGSARRPPFTRGPYGWKPECPFGGQAMDYSPSNESHKKLDSRFVKDVTIFDGTELGPGTRFTKIWRMTNNGTLPWPLGTQLAHIGGDEMSSVEVVNLELPEGGLPCGEDVEVSVDLMAPDNAGRYVSHWRLMSPSGQKFGHRVWVVIQVVPQGEQSPQLQESLKGGEKIVNVQEISHEIRDVTLDEMDVDGRGKGLLISHELEREKGTSSNAVTAAILGGVHVFPADEGKQPVFNNEMDVELEGYSIVEKPVESRDWLSLLPQGAAGTEQHLEKLAAPTGKETAEASQVTQLQLLESMGFVDRDLNVLLLKKNNESVQATLDDLLLSAGWDGVLRDLQEMGFNDQTTNVRLLVKNKGSIKLVVKDLVRMEKQEEGKDVEEI